MAARGLLAIVVALLVSCGKGPQGTPGKRIIMLRFQAGSASTEEREQGFLDVVSRETDLFFLSNDQRGGATTESTYNTVQGLFERYKGVLDGLFCPNESTTFGALQVIQESHLAGRIAFVGFDSSPRLIAALREKTLHGLILQDPLRMGQLGVETVVRHIRGEAVEKRIDTGVYAVTPENMDSPEMVALLSPPCNDWLKREADLPAAGEGVLTIAVIPKERTNEYWKTIHAGAIKGAFTSGTTTIIWRGPLLEDDREDQIKIMDEFIARSVDGIVLAPLDDEALVPSVEKAMANGVPVVIMDSGLKSDTYVSFVATDNFTGGQLAARRLAEILRAVKQSDGK